MYQHQVYFRFGGGIIPPLGLADYWSTQECSLMNTYEQGSDTFFKCSCSHFGSFALQMEDLDENEKVVSQIILKY